MYLALTRMPGESYCTRLRSFLWFLCVTFSERSFTPLFVDSVSSRGRKEKAERESGTKRRGRILCIGPQLIRTIVLATLACTHYVHRYSPSCGHALPAKTGVFVHKQFLRFQ